MSEQYPNKCSRCGFCCLSQTCKVAAGLYHISQETPCPGLSFEEGIAICDLVRKMNEEMKISFGIGAGCCIKAIVYRGDEKLDYAGLPEEEKKRIVAKLRGEL
jgi:hypothetical protein